MSNFGSHLREARRAAGLSQRRLAELAGVDFSYISKLENGRLPPPAAETISRFAQAVGCPSEELFSAAGKIPTTVGNALAEEPAALRFLQEVTQLGLSPHEWEQLRKHLRGIRSPGEGGSGRGDR